MHCSRAGCALVRRGRRTFGAAVATARASHTITRTSYSSSFLENRPERSSRLEPERGEQHSMSMRPHATMRSKRPWSDLGPRKTRCNAK